MTGPHIEDHLTHWQELEQERDHYQEQYEAVQKELKEVKKELKHIKDIYFRNN